MKANNGLFIVDDLGRQLVSPQDLMNRWIVPLDRHVDYFALHTGKKFQVPFDVIVVFSSNLQPSKLRTRRFCGAWATRSLSARCLRSDYRRIFMKVCEDNGIPFDEDGYRYLVRELHPRNAKPLLGLPSARHSLPAARLRALQ